MKFELYVRLLIEKMRYFIFINIIYGKREIVFEVKNFRC